MPAIPPKKRRALFWNKLPTHSLARTVWSELPPTAINVADEVARLDELFALGGRGAAAGRGADEPAGGAKKAAPTTLIDLTRSQNIAIMLSRIKIPFAQLRTALLQLDESVLTEDNLKALKACVPTSEEMELIREYDGDVSALSKADQFFKEMLGIPKLSERLTCMLYMRRFEFDVEELKPDLKVLKHAVDELNSSTKFKAVLHTVLMVGNVLNSSTFRGSAAGFQLADLLKLRETKPAMPTPGTPTLLHYLVRLLNKTDRDLVGFLDDCAHVEAAARLSTQTVMASVTTLVQGHDGLVEELQILEQTCVSPQGDRFLSSMRDFTATCTAQIKALQAGAAAVQTSLVRLLAYYGEDAAQTKPEDFFGLVASFGQALMRAEAEVAELDAKAKRAAKPGQGQGLVIPQFGPEVRGPVDTGRRSYRGARGQLDEAIKELRAGRKREATGAGGTLKGVGANGTLKSMRAKKDTVRANAVPLSGLFALRD